MLLCAYEVATLFHSRSGCISAMVDIIPVYSMKVPAEEKCNINLRHCFYLQGDLCLVVVEIH